MTESDEKQLAAKTDALMRSLASDIIVPVGLKPTSEKVQEFLSRKQQMTGFEINVENSLARMMDTVFQKQKRETDKE